MPNRHRSRERPTSFAAEFCAAALLLASASAVAEEYPSKAACIRASEPAEKCAKLFPEAPPPKIPPGPIEACTGMLNEATAQLRQAIVYIRFDSIDEASARWRRAHSLSSSATSCARTAVGTRAALADWEAAQTDYSVQQDVMTAAMRARGD